ncbi:unnamed protein product [Prunus armeniaca]|uniref:AAA+ ATPase domain-containing protein n=1 Tax=Prunus armeniaca TaxID=36596 RepID=A0A6J5UGS7_PRUAR|nr:unnamed protein product [Prunus armeniaca]
MFPAVLAGLLGVGVGGIEVAYADTAEKDISKPSSPAESPATESHVDLDEISKKQRQKIEDLLRSKGIRRVLHVWKFNTCTHAKVFSLSMQCPLQKTTCRFDSIITFNLPDQQNRKEIAAQYAKHLTESELDELATATEGMSGRDIRDVCQQAERSWASKIIRGQISKDGGEQGSSLLPPLQHYLDSALNRLKAHTFWRSVTYQKAIEYNNIGGVCLVTGWQAIFELGAFEHQFHSNAYEIQVPNPNGSGRNLMFPAVLAGLLGVGGIEVAYADAAEEDISKPSSPTESPATESHVDLEEIAKKQRQKIEDLLKSKGIRRGSYPQFTVAVKGQKVSIKFQIPPACEASQLIANIASHLGLKVEEHGGGSDMSLRAWDSGVAWQLMLTRPEKKKETGSDRGELKDVNKHEGDLRILVFRSVITPSDKADIEFMKEGSLSPKELDALVAALQLAGTKLGQNSTSERRPREDTTQVPSSEKLIASLESMGVRIYGINEPHVSSSSKEISWDNIAGYDQQKRDIEDTILLALLSPKTYDDIARGTRCKFESNRPRAVLFEGPPGTGKTSSARVIANQAGVPLLYVPLEVILSKYYGESERLLGRVFSLANQLPDGAIIFLDEVDSFAISRDSDMHEATRRVLSVLLRQIDGFEQDKKVVVIAATNRKQDLDPAMISRFDSIITFDLPDQRNRKEIAAQYAKHLTESELDELATATEGMSGRDIRDVCQQAERSWASKIIRGQISKDGGEQGSILLPPLQHYLDSALNRLKGLLTSAQGKPQSSESGTKKPKLLVD